jgi:hypothetical protein
VIKLLLDQVSIKKDFGAGKKSVVSWMKRRLIRSLSTRGIKKIVKLCWQRSENRKRRSI